MRLVQVFVPRGDLDRVSEVGDAMGADYAVSTETGGKFEALVTIPAPPAAVDPLLSELRAAALDDRSYTVVLGTETTVSNRADALTERFSETSVSREELRARAAELAPAASTYFGLLVVSTVIATVGLLLDSAATIIGAVVVVPLTGPAFSASVGAVVELVDAQQSG